MESGTVSEKGQITLPVKVRRQLGIKPRDRVTFKTEKDGVFIRKAVDFFSLAGSIKTKKKMTVEEIKDKMQTEVARDVVRKSRLK